MKLEMKQKLAQLGFFEDEDEYNIFYRKARDTYHDVIRYFPWDDSYNLAIEDEYYESINEETLLKLARPKGEFFVYCKMSNLTFFQA